MSNFFHPKTSQVSNKVHQCILCAHAIEKGERYIKQSGVWEFEYVTNKYHVACWDVLELDGDHEFMPGSGEPPEGVRTMKEALASEKGGG